jgi:hypothetical protein
MSLRFFTILIFVAATACTHAAPPPADAPTAVKRLIDASWTLPPNSQGYVCAYLTVHQDMFVGEFSPVIPPGTHHTVLTMGPPMHADGVEACDGVVNAPNMIFGSGVGTGDYVFPPGVAVRIPAGSQLVLNLHLFNAQDTPLSGLSGTDVRLIDPAEVTQQAEAVLAGTVDLNVTPGASTATGRCTMRDAETIFAVGNHMHKLGTHLAVTARPVGTAPTVLVDRDYSFDSQLIYEVAPSVTLAAGDSVEVTCQYYNPTGTTVHWGESTTDEMCFSGLYWYPARQSSYVCVQ